MKIHWARRKYNYKSGHLIRLWSTPAFRGLIHKRELAKNGDGALRSRRKTKRMSLNNKNDYEQFLGQILF